jgi:D-alanyl-D-alanine carboxypeptidase (penicillin-binding protein 5/6)
LKFLTSIILAVYLLFNVTPPLFANETSNYSESTLPKIHGEAAYLIDVQSGQTLFAKNSDELLAPASTTKIMTGLLAIEHGNLNDIVTASSTMLNNKLVYGTQIYLVPGEKMSLRDLLYALFLNSANDAAVDIAEYIGGSVSHFVDMMNQRAQEIGADHTHFLNPSGLTEKGHVTTAHDLALIARVAYKNPVFDQYVDTKTHTISRLKTKVPTLMVNENKLLWRDSSVDGIKTGYTAAAENCLVASMNKDGRQVIGVILKSPGAEIYPDMQNMLNYGFSQFKDIVYKPAGSVISTININNQPVNLILSQPIYQTQELNQPSTTLSMRVIPSYTVPLTKVETGQVIANVRVFDGENLLDTIPLKAARTILPQTKQNLLHPKDLIWGVCLLLGGALIFIRRIKINQYKYRCGKLHYNRRKESN